MNVFVLLNTKEDILKNLGSSGSLYCFPTMEVNGALKQPDYKISSKYLPLCSAEQRYFSINVELFSINVEITSFRPFFKQLKKYLKNLGKYNLTQYCNFISWNSNLEICNSKKCTKVFFHFIYYSVAETRFRWNVMIFPLKQERQFVSVFVYYIFHKINARISEFYCVFPSSRSYLPAHRFRENKSG